MVKPFRFSPQDFIHLLPAFLVAALAIPLWFMGEVVLAVAVLVGAGIWSAATLHLLRQVARANAQKTYLDQQLIQSQKLASIGELSSGIAHEINNPLAVISQEVEWVQHLLGEDAAAGAANKEDVKDSLQEIARQVDRCKEITHKLLDFARKKEPLIQMVDINKLIEDMTKLVEKEAVRKGIAITRAYHKDLPPISTDPPLVRQVILNLLNNATYAVGKDGCILIETRMSQNHSIDIVVQDNGCGIPREHLDKVFDPFFTTKPPGKGTGLGLSICHGIIARLGGHISVSSEPGTGTIFVIHLPVKMKPRKGQT